MAVEQKEAKKEIKNGMKWAQNARDIIEEVANKWRIGFHVALNEFAPEGGQASRYLRCIFPINFPLHTLYEIQNEINTSFQKMGILLVTSLYVDNLGQPTLNIKLNYEAIALTNQNIVSYRADFEEILRTVVELDNKKNYIVSSQQELQALTSQIYKLKNIMGEDAASDLHKMIGAAKDVKETNFPGTLRKVWGMSEWTAGHRDQIVQYIEKTLQKNDSLNVAEQTNLSLIRKALRNIPEYSLCHEVILSVIDCGVLNSNKTEAYQKTINNIQQYVRNLDKQVKKDWLDAQRYVTDEGPKELKQLKDKMNAKVPEHIPVFLQAVVRLLGDFESLTSTRNPEAPEAKARQKQIYLSKVFFLKKEWEFQASQLGPYWKNYCEIMETFCDLDANQRRQAGSDLQRELEKLIIQIAPEQKKKQQVEKRIAVESTFINKGGKFVLIPDDIVKAYYNGIDPKVAENKRTSQLELSSPMQVRAKLALDRVLFSSNDFVFDEKKAGGFVGIGSCEEETISDSLRQWQDLEREFNQKIVALEPPAQQSSYLSDFWSSCKEKVTKNPAKTTVAGVATAATVGTVLASYFETGRADNYLTQSLSEKAPGLESWHIMLAGAVLLMVGAALYDRYRLNTDLSQQTLKRTAATFSRRGEQGD